MLDKLNIVKQRFDEVSDLIIQPDIITDQKRYVQLNKEYKDLKLLMDKREQYISLTNNIAEAEEIISDGSDTEMLEMAKMQLEEAREALPKLDETTTTGKRQFGKRWMGWENNNERLPQIHVRRSWNRFSKRCTIYTKEERRI